MYDLAHLITTSHCGLNEGYSGELNKEATGC
ncbi:hypothetical protein PVAP13_6NG352400 [Panicum virgatum]|uniref:Uncharacterized protein n=1 Tax=Panicum virgatum TaxID=38727 RepID=A0A8T0R6A9_PANVG|nr:hypothetical protein PVAP13_6NG352400 [Panicum virgatum]